MTLNKVKNSTTNDENLSHTSYIYLQSVEYIFQTNTSSAKCEINKIKTIYQCNNES